MTNEAREPVERPDFIKYGEGIAWLEKQRRYDLVAVLCATKVYVAALEAELARLKAPVNAPRPDRMRAVLERLLPYVEAVNHFHLKDGTILYAGEVWDALHGPVADALPPRPDIEGLERLSEKANPGQWIAKGSPVDADESQVARFDYCSDAEFTAALRNAFPALAAYVRGLEGKRIL